MEVADSNINKLTRLFDHKDDISQTQAAREFRCHQTYIGKTLQRHTDIEVRTKEKIPDRTEEQKVKIVERCGRLYKKYRNLLYVMDDKSYFALKHTHIHGNRKYCTSNKAKTSLNVK